MDEPDASAGTRSAQARVSELSCRARNLTRSPGQWACRLRPALHSFAGLLPAMSRMPEHTRRRSLLSTARAGLVALVVGFAAAGCGGGDNAAPGFTPPATGLYSWVLKTQGSAAAPRFGLSLIHPQEPGVEYLVEPPSAVLGDVRLVTTGSVEAVTARVTGLRAHTLLYVAAGDVRALPLDANGSAPASRVRRAQSTTVCRFVEGIDANDHAQPFNSRFVLRTAGADGRCDSADDGQAELALDSSGTPRLSSLSEGPLAATRDPATLAPRGWIYANRVVFWTPPAGGVGSTANLRSAGEPAFTSVLLSAPNAALADDGQRLALIDFGSAASVSVRPLDSALTGGGSWQPMGFDGDSFYAFRNSTNTNAGRWSVLKVVRASGSASVLAAGDGAISNTAMGTTRLYVSVLGLQGNRLLSIGKSSPGQVQTLESTPGTTLSIVLASANAVHQVFRAVNIGSASVGYAIEFIDEAGTRLYSTSTGGYPLLQPEATTRFFNTSENRARFVFVSGFGSRGFGDTTLISYDTATRSATTLGPLPGVSAFGQDIVYANTTSGPGSFFGLYVARLLDGSVQDTGAQVLSFEVGVANSLNATTVQR